jgi:hypothetical protein
MGLPGATAGVPEVACRDRSDQGRRMCLAR